MRVWHESWGGTDDTALGSTAPEPPERVWRWKLLWRRFWASRCAF